MGISIKIDVKIVTKIKGGIEGIMIADDELLPFDQELEEIWVIHPEESERGTCEECAGLAGTTFKVGEGQYPPIHANCVCERVPAIPTYNPQLGAWNVPARELSLTKRALDNMGDEALAEMSSAENYDAATQKRITAILKARRDKGGK